MIRGVLYTPIFIQQHYDIILIPKLTISTHSCTQVKLGGNHSFELSLAASRTHHNSVENSVRPTYFTFDVF